MLCMVYIEVGVLKDVHMKIDFKELLWRKLMIDLGAWASLVSPRVRVLKAELETPVSLPKSPVVKPRTLTPALRP